MEQHGEPGRIRTFCMSEETEKVYQELKEVISTC